MAEWLMAALGRGAVSLSFRRGRVHERPAPSQGGMMTSVPCLLFLILVAAVAFALSVDDG